MKISLAPVLFVACLLPQASIALPRFAARNGQECVQCHVNPTGGGMRNAYGRNVFEHAFLPATSGGNAQAWLAEPFATEEELSGHEKQLGQRIAAFSPDLNEWLSIGADVRGAYIFIRPDRGPAPAAPREITSSFFLMQADLYHWARLNEFVSLYLDVGVYSGFEAWGMIHWRLGDAGPHGYLKVGRFLPPFGIREVEHQLATREAVGFGQTDRDTGVELTAYYKSATLSAAVINGTLGDIQFDTSGQQRRTFEKGVSSRLSLRIDTGWLRAQAGASFYYSDNTNQPNPSLAASVPAALAADAAKGVDEMRGGLFLTANVGRFTYLGDLVGVRDVFRSNTVPTLMGYASYQELSFLLMQGLELVATFEFLDPDMGVLNDAGKRAGLVIEYFPLPYVELRAMARRAWDGVSPTGGRWDFVLFLHLFM